MAVADAGWPLPVPLLSDAAAGRAALSGRVAVVTGASRGLGAGMAARFAARGLRLGLCARHRPAPPAPQAPAVAGMVASGVPGDPDDPENVVLRMAVDVTEPGQVDDFARLVVQRFGRIDLWVNNAGVLAPIGPLAEADAAEVAANVAVNILGVAHGSQAMARHVRTRVGGGVLVNVSSGAARRPYAGWAPYCASKAAVDMLTGVVALEERHAGLRAYAVAPGVVDTDMQAAIRATDEHRFPEVERFRQLRADHAFSSPGWVADRLLDLAFGPGDPGGLLLRVPTEPGPRPDR